MTTYLRSLNRGDLLHVNTKSTTWWPFREFSEEHPKNGSHLASLGLVCAWAGIGLGLHVLVFLWLGADLGTSVARALGAG
jgi:hypothetical protein